MKIALICDGPVPHDRMNYRGEVLLRLLPGKDHTVYVVCATPRDGERIASPGSQLIQLTYGAYKPVVRTSSLFVRLWQVVSLFRATRRALKQPLDVVRTISLIPTVIALLARPKRQPAPIVANLSDFYSDLYSGGRLPLPGLAKSAIRYMEKFCARADFFIVDTAEQRERWILSGIPRSRCAAIPHGLPRSWAAAGSVPTGHVEDSWTAPAGTRTVFYVGDIGEMDGVDVLLGAVAFLRRRGMDVRLLLVGSGTASYMRSLSLLAKDLRVGDLIERIGSVANRELPLLMEKADVCVAPFRLRDTSSTSIPNKVLEYLTTERPIIVPSGSALERIFGEALIYFVPEDSESLSRAILRGLAVVSQHMPTYRQLRYAIQERFNWKPIIEQEYRVIHDAATGNVMDAEFYDYALEVKSTVSAR